jgi:ribosomal peptide maturation radical SAM protein 1
MPHRTKAAADTEPLNNIRLSAAGGPCPHVDAVRQPGDDFSPSDAVRNYRVALVTMPFACCFRPSIQLGHLTAIVRRAGFPVDDHHLNMDLAAKLGFDVYDAVAGDAYIGFNGEWLSSVAAFGEDSNRGDFFSAFPEELVRIEAIAHKDVAYLNDLRDRAVPQFIDDCVDRIDWASYSAIGFASELQHIVAGLALARRIKEKYPHITIILAGGNMAGEMGREYVRAFPYVDYGVSGDGNLVFPELLTRLAEGCDATDVPGVVARQGDRISFLGPAPPVRDMDCLPIPDYYPFFDAAMRCGLDRHIASIEDPERRSLQCGIPIQDSRGCWWAERSHCTFCSACGADVTFSSKSSERILAEIEELSKRHGSKYISIQHCILDLKFIKGVFEPLGMRGEDYLLSCCLRASLTRDQLRVLARGGLRASVPGVESVNSRLLKLMRKGVTKLQNINLLKWCRYYDIGLFWHLLHGFPGEKIEDYADQLATLRLITHLPPALDCPRIRLDRFSPNFDDEQLFPTEWRRPSAAYNYIYPAHVNVEEIACFYDYGPAGNVLPDEALQETVDFVSTWRSAWSANRRPSLTYRYTRSEVLIDDTRFGQDAPRSYRLCGADADIYEAFSSAPRTAAQVCAALASECPELDIDEDSVRFICEDLCEAGLMVGESGKYLSLAIPADPEF